MTPLSCIVPLILAAVVYVMWMAGTALMEHNERRNTRLVTRHHAINHDGHNVTYTRTYYFWFFYDRRKWKFRK